MFEIGLWELLVIGVIALIVVGPERMPGLARNVGLWVGKARRFIADVQSEFTDELKKADELQHLVKKELEIKELHETIELDESRKNVAVPKQSQAAAVDQSPQPASTAKDGIQEEKTPRD